MARPLQVWFEAKADYPVFGPLLRQDWFPYFIAWTGVIYDGLIVFLLLHPKTRKLGFALSLLFNLFNSAVFQIGVFPYLMIAFTVFFFPGERLRTLFFKNKPQVVPIRRSLSNVVLVPFLLFLLIQVLLPLRHHLFEGDVHWTEEGHRLSWQMMLRAKRSTTGYYVEDKQTGERERVKLLDYMTPDQRWDFGNKPDMIWQFAQRLKHVYAEKGKDVAVYAHIKVSLNGSKFAHLIDPDVDLASVPWERFSHSDWILDENRPKK